MISACRQFAGRHKRDLLSLLFPILWTVFLSVYGDFTFDLNDDVMLRDLLSGNYTGSPTAYCVYILYPLAFVLALLYRILPIVPWFGLFLWGSFFLCQYLLTRRIAGLFAKRSPQVTAWRSFQVTALVTFVCFWCGVLGYRQLFLHYSFTAALLAGTGGFLFLTSDAEKNGWALWRDNIGSILLVATGFLLRSQMVLLLAPMFAVIGLVKWCLHASILRDHDQDGNDLPLKESISRYLKTFFDRKTAGGFLLYLGSVLVLCLLGLGIHKLAYLQTDWAEYTRFNAARTELYDYQRNIPPYDLAQAFYEEKGIFSSQVEMLQNYNMCLDPALSTQTLQDIIDYNRDTLGIPHYIYSLREVLPTYRYRVTHEQDSPWIFFVWALYLLCILSVTDCGRLGMYPALLCLFAARSIGWIYPLMRGRLEIRVSDSLYLVEILLLFGLLLVMWSRPACGLMELLTQMAMRRENEGRGGSNSGGRNSAGSKASAAGRSAAERKLAAQKEEKNLFRHFLQDFVILALVCVVAAWLNLSLAGQEAQRRKPLFEQWDTMQAYFADHPENFYAVDVYSTVDYSEKAFAANQRAYRNFDICGGWSSESPARARKWSRLTGEEEGFDVLLQENARFAVREEFYSDFLTNAYAQRGESIVLLQEDRISIPESSDFLIFRVQR